MNSSTASEKPYLSIPFKPAPWCLNGHHHTVLCSLLFQPVHLPFERIRIPTPDDDFLDLDILSREHYPKTAVLFHGLEGTSRRYYMTRLAYRLFQENYNIVSVNFRSCSGTLNKQKRFYHSGEIKDPETVFEWITRELPSSDIYAAGFSLGGSIILNYARHHGTAHPVTAFAAISTPFDLKQGALNLQKGFNRIYQQLFVRSLTKKLEEKRKSISGLPEMNGKTLYEYDDQVTAPLHGFDSADHYYESCSAAFFLEEIASPCLLLHSKEDPICPIEFLPLHKVQNNSKLDARLTDTGGHVGFWSLPPGWVEETVCTYFESV